MDGFEVISCYSRAQAIADGVLVDVSELAREVGYRWPVAFTDHLWHDYVVPPLDLVSEGQSISGRLWDVLNVLKYTIGLSRDDSRLSFSVLFAMEPGKAPIPVELVSSRDRETTGVPRSPSCCLRTIDAHSPGLASRGPPPSPLSSIAPSVLIKKRYRDPTPCTRSTRY